MIIGKNTIHEKKKKQQQPWNHGKSKNVKMPTFTQLF